MVDFSPPAKRLEEDDLGELVEAAQVGSRSSSSDITQDRALEETPDQDLLEIIEKYRGRLAEPAESITYSKEEGSLYFNNGSATEEYTFESGEGDVAIVEGDVMAIADSIVNPEESKKYDPSNDQDEGNFDDAFGAMEMHYHFQP